jgi:hypothetical protein
MNLLSHLKRKPGEDWFALVVAVAPGGLDGTDAKIVAKLAPRCRTGGWRFEPMHDGELVFYPNDAVLSESSRMSYYRNNHGQIWVQLTRLPD